MENKNNDKNFIEQYFYNETKGFKIAKLELVDQKASYFDTVDCYLIETTLGYRFYVFKGNITYTNLYPVREGETLEEVYYKHIGFIAEFTSEITSKNFILDFSKDFYIFPILDRKLAKLYEQITLDKDSSQLMGIANQIRDCYLDLSSYLMDKNKTKNTQFKQDNFKDNFCEFLNLIIPGKKSETRRNTFNGIAKKGWDYNSELVHKDSITIFDIMTSFNILSLIISITSNLLTGNDMPFNKIKCPKCGGEDHKIQKDENSSNYLYNCEFCGNVFEVDLCEIIKNI